MKAIVYFSILALIIALCTWSDCYMQKSSDTLLHTLNRLDTQLNSNQSPTEYSTILGQWKKTRPNLEFITDHKALEQIQNKLIALKGLLSDKEKMAEARSLIGELNSQIKGIPDHMRLRLGNLF